MTPELLPTFGLGTKNHPHNFCRNPDHSSNGPWCYINNGPGRESCAIDSCPKTVQPNEPDNGPSAVRHSQSNDC